MLVVLVRHACPSTKEAAMAEPLKTRRTTGGAAGDDPDLASNPPPADAGRETERTDLNADQVRRWARLVADGTEAFPQGLGARQERPMLDEVRRLRRARLVRFIAGQVARDFLSSADRDPVSRQGGRQP
jgi:hypothetical protein